MKDVKMNSLLGEHAWLTCFAHYIICSKTSMKFANHIFGCRRRHLSFTTLLAFFKQLSAARAEMETSRSSALMGLCATGGAVAVLSSAGLVPAIGLAMGLGGGWLLGQKLKEKPQKPQALNDANSLGC